MNPLEYGKLVTKIDNKYIVRINNTQNIAIITQLENENKVVIVKSKDMHYEYVDK
jgi:plasmid maintenance system killer protein